MKRKLLILCNCASGLYDFRGMLIRSFVEKGYEVQAVVPVTEEAVELAAEENLLRIGCKLQAMPIDRRGINPLTDAKLLLRYVRVILKAKPDLVITYTIKCNLYGGVVCRLLHIPYAINITGLGTAFQKKGMIRTLVTALYKIACKKAQVVFFENEANRQFFINEGMASEDQTHRLYGAGVDLNRFAIAEYPKEEEPVRFLFIGRVMKEKGIDEFFEAAQHIKNQFPATEFHVVGNYEDDYAAKTEQLVKEGVISFHGYQEDVRPFIAQSAAFVLPSYHEGMANTLLEAGAMARPLITTNIPGCREAVQDKKTGFLFEKKNTDALIWALEQFLALTYEGRKQMGLKQHDFVAAWFDKRVVVQETMKRLGI